MIFPTLILRVKRAGQDDIRIETKNSRRFLHYIRTMKWPHDILEVYLKVIYKPGVWNDSDGIESKEELLNLYRYFTNKELLKYTQETAWD